MTDMRDPSLHAGVQSFERDLSLSEPLPEFYVAALKCHSIASFEPQMAGIHAPTEKWNSRLCWEDLRFGFMQGESKRCEKSHHFKTPLVQAVFIFSKEQEVIHVTDVAGAFEFALDEMIQRIEIYVRPELAGKVANRQTARSQD